MESSDSDDCLIYNFVEAKYDKFFAIEDDEPLLKKFKREKQEDWKKKMKGKEEQGDLELVIVPGDGHCISHCFSKHLSKEEILQTVDQYIKPKKYINGTIDLFVHAFSKAYRVNEELFQADGVLFIDGGFNQSIKLQKRGDHYMFKSVSYTHLTLPTKA